MPRARKKRVEVEKGGTCNDSLESIEVLKMELSISKKISKTMNSFMDEIMQANPGLLSSKHVSEGRQTTLRYFLSSTQSENKNKFAEEFERLSGMKISDFPEKIDCPGKGFMRVTDVTIRRFALSLRVLEQYKVISLVYRYHQILKNLEKELLGGSGPEMDRRTSVKLLDVLAKYNLIKLYTGEMTVDGKNEQVLCICHRDICEDNPLVLDALHVSSHGNGDSPSPKRLKEVCSSNGEPKKSPVKKAKMEPIEPKMQHSGKSSMTTIIRISGLQGFRQKQCSAKAMTLASPDRDTPSRNEEAPSPTMRSKAGRKPFAALDETLASNDVSFRYGFQSKQVRMEVLHELLFYVTRDYKGSGPSLIDLIPTFPDHDLLEPFNKRDNPPQFLNPHVYLDEITWRRFLPRLPVYSDTHIGWLLVYDLMLIMPLSLFLILIPAKRQLPELDEYLHDPIKRHTPMCHLTNSLRYDLFCCVTNKRFYTYDLSRLLQSLCLLGVAAWGPMSAATRMTNLKFEFFYVHDKVSILDTSSSDKGFMVVEQPMSKYKAINYQFETESDVMFFWQHLRAICLSTELGFRGTRTQIDESLARISLTGLLDSTRLSQFEPHPKSFRPGEPIGCAGCDPRLFMFKSRNWSVNPCETASWFAESMRQRSHLLSDKAISKTCKPRDGLSTFLNTYVPLEFHDPLGPSTTPAHKRSAPPMVVLKNFAQLQKSALDRCKVFRGSIHPRVNSIATTKRTFPPMSKVASSAVRIKAGDTRVAMRAKYSTQEMEMLYLIKALSFFLEPTMRMWFGHKTVAAACHKYVPKSRDKRGMGLTTVMNRYLLKKKEARAKVDQFIHKLNSLPEMRALKERTNISMRLNENVRSGIFLDALDLCHGLVFQENKQLNSAHANEKDLRLFLESNSLHSAVPPVLQDRTKVSLDDEVCSEDNVTSMFSWKEFAVVNLEVIQESMFHNLVQASCGLAKGENKFLVPFYELFRCFPTELTLRVLSRLKKVQLLTVTRAADRNKRVEERKLFMFHGEYSFSFLYRSFFSGSLSSNIPQQTAQLMNELEKNGVTDLMLTNNMGCPALAAAMLGQDNVAIIVTMQDDIFGVHDESSSELNTETEEPASGTKVKLLQLRQQALAQCEAADSRTLNLSLEKAALIKPITLEARLKNFVAMDKKDIEKEKENRKNLLSMLLTYLPVEGNNLKKPSFDWCMLPEPLRNKENKELCRDIVQVVERSNISGITLQAIKLGFPSCSCVESLLLGLCEMGVIVLAGVCEHVYVHITHINVWAICSTYVDEAKKRHTVYYMPRPWLKPDGTFNLPMLRWMAEGIFLQLANRPLKCESEVLDAFDPVLTPVCTMHLIDFLIQVQAIRVTINKITDFDVQGAFSRKELESDLKLLEPLPDGATKLGKVFLGVGLPDFVLDSKLTNVQEKKR